VKNKKSHITVGFQFYPFPPLKVGGFLTGLEFVGVPPPPPLGFGEVVLISIPAGFEFEGGGEIGLISRSTGFSMTSGLSSFSVGFDEF
jgi:hypothetical protein